jgi:DNA-binding transcriptional MerR regulator
VVGVDGYPVGEVATLAHVSVRTLHHYDEIGLLRPSERTAAGHRRYTAADLQRLQQLRFYRELGFGLDEIAAILADPGVGAEEHLRNRHPTDRTATRSPHHRGQPTAPHRPRCAVAAPATEPQQDHPATAAGPATAPTPLRNHRPSDRTATRSPNRGAGGDEGVHA